MSEEMSEEMSERNIYAQEINKMKEDNETFSEYKMNLLVEMTT